MVKRETITDCAENPKQMRRSDKFHSESRYPEREQISSECEDAFTEAASVKFPFVSPVIVYLHPRAKRTEFS